MKRFHIAQGTTSIHPLHGNLTGNGARSSVRVAAQMETKQPTLLGHPKGLFYLAATEAWERFSYYGMTALVVLYMVNQLLLPGHVEHISAPFVLAWIGRSAARC